MHGTAELWDFPLPTPLEMMLGGVLPWVLEVHEGVVLGNPSPPDRPAAEANDNAHDDALHLPHLSTTTGAHSHSHPSDSESGAHSHSHPSDSESGTACML